MTKTPTLSGLIAYPSFPEDIGNSISSAIQKLRTATRFSNLATWEESDIPGRFIHTKILEKINKGNLLVADITILNFNVAFEIGYAIGCRKRVFLIQNNNIKGSDELKKEIGIFDTLAHKKYSNSDSLKEVLSDIKDLTPLQFDANKTSHVSPVYLVLPPLKGDIETHLIARIKKAKLFYRSFDPQEIGRLSGFEALENVALSHGIIIPLLAEHFKGSQIHNLRAAFVAGLAMGMNKPLLLLQSGHDPVPIDYADLVNHFKFLRQMDEFISEFAPRVIANMQSARPPVITESKNLLQRLNLGASSAENEYRTLSDYYLITDEFHRVESGEVQIVLGRKGSGKSALFFQLRDRVRNNPQMVVVDLKPEGFQLLKFKKQVLDYLEEGTREHTITAFWEYLLLLEICHKLLENDRAIYLRNHKIFQPYQELAALYASDQFISEGDFAERMLTLTQRITEDFKEHGTINTKQRLTTGEITSLLYQHDVRKLLIQLSNYLQQKKGLLILLDNIDKGWPPHGITPEDVLSLRCLLDAMAKIKKEFQKKQIPTTATVFIRNDVYENLVKSMPDRGKISSVLVDWTDPALLREILRRRFLSSGIKGDPPFEDIWQQICVSHINGQDSADYLIDRCLMRPRSLIEMLKACLSHAINLGHDRIQVEDILKGEEIYSTQSVIDISYEIQDILPESENVLYEFIESPSEFNEKQMNNMLSNISSEEQLLEQIRNLLLWYGVIGFKRKEGEFTFIYSVKYDMSRLLALLKRRSNDGIIYVINPAFWAGLEIKHS